ncbi:MAG: purine-nucleoside phosphorylase [Candidatus Krumholzibacteriia bacterium]
MRPANERLQILSPHWRDRVGEAAGWLAARGHRGRVGLILGSGLGNLVDALEDTRTVEYRDIPGYATTTVAEHRGRLVTGTAAGIPVVVMQGRLHPYEGLPWAELLLPTAVLACLGIDVALVTNAAGGLNRFFTPGDLMVIRDQLDLHLVDPLRGLLAAPGSVPAAGSGTGGGDRSGAVAGPTAAVAPTPGQVAADARGPRVAPLYDPELAHLLVLAAAEAGVPVHAGTYASMWGPVYETPAEIGMLRRAGCDAVGMSTAGETVLLRALGVKAVGLSCITNPSRETGQPELSHADVVEAGALVRERLRNLVWTFLPKIAEQGSS